MTVVRRSEGPLHVIPPGLAYQADKLSAVFDRPHHRLRRPPTATWRAVRNERRRSSGRASRFEVFAFQNG